MSNAIVGAVYAQIIEKVIQASQNDFEEGGVDQQTLQELKEVWQKNLSNQQIAQFPWDPPPPPQHPPTLPSNDSKPPTASGMQQSAQATSSYGGVRVKQEGGYEPQMYPQQMNNFTSGLDRDIAAQRAQQLLQNNYGAQAQASIAAGQQQQQQRAQPPTGLSLPGQPRQGLSLPGQPSMQQRPPQQQQMPPQQRPNGIANSQTDGAGDAADDWAAVMQEHRTQPEGSRAAVDRLFHAKLEDMSHNMDSGLMVPLNEHPQKKGKTLRAPVRSAEATASSSFAPSVPQLDGELDNEEEQVKVELDEDAINSDLDDPEDDNIQDGDDEENLGDNMLCTYDKVQRVKNKWKCTLKDGVLSAKGKDYLFHKAQGEFEW